MTTFSISLDSKTNVFFPDSEVTGKIYLNTTEANTVKQVNVTIIGRAHVFFTISTGRFTYPYESEQFYINNYPCEVQYYGFSVCPIIDLNNLDPKLKLSASTEITQIERKCFSCTKNPLNVKVSLF
uniref:Arrestin-like N-terminal domain-containing protein n=1 Tax=Panagrolaimus davidi TaxID=227884 RepID=A0A914R4T1_9BILA